MHYYVRFYFSPFLGHFLFLLQEQVATDVQCHRLVNLQMLP